MVVALQKPSAIPVPAPHSLACLSLPDFSWDDEENNQTPNTSDDADKSNGMEVGQRCFCYFYDTGDYDFLEWLYPKTQEAGTRG